MAALLAASALFLAIHLLVSGTRLRDGIVGAIGEQPYLGLFALSSLGAIIWLCIAYNHFYGSAENRVLFDLGQSFPQCRDTHCDYCVSARRAGRFDGQPHLRRTIGCGHYAACCASRVILSFGAWPSGRLIIFLSSGLVASVILFGTFLVVALLGTRAIDGKVRRKRPDEWQAISSQTSNIPFVAILAGRNKFVAREYFDWRALVAVLAVALFLLIHNYLFKMSPFPNNWLPF